MTAVQQVSEDRIAARAAELQDKLSILRVQLAERTIRPEQITDGLYISGGSDAERSKDAASIPTVRNPSSPKTLDEMVGQETLIQQLRVVILGAMLQGRKIPHSLVVGSPGAGKTTVAQIIADEIGVPLIRTSGMELKKSSDLVGLLMGTEGKPCCVFVDEIHAAKKECQETLYSLLESGTLDVLGGSGPDTVATTQALPGLIIIGATTAPGKLTQPFRDRFGFVGQMEPYTPEQIATIVGRFWKSRDVRYAKREPMALAVRSKLIPRRALHLSERVLDYMNVQESETITEGMVSDALNVFGIDSSGLDRNDVAVLRSLVKDFAGRPTGVDALANRLSLDVSTLSDSIEPYLAQAGFLVRTKTGRVATAKAHELVRGES